MEIPVKKIMWGLVLLTGMVACGDGNTPANGAEQAAATNTPDAKATDRRFIIFFGNSLTAGYGIDMADAFPALIQQRLDTLGYSYTVVNAGLSGETTASGVNRVDWVIGQQPVDIFVLELGGNDGLRGIPVVETRKNLMAIIDKVRAKHPQAEIILAGMMVPPNMGIGYGKDFQAVYPAVAREKKVKLIPFLLDKVGGEDSLNLPDGIHPTEAGHLLVRDNVWAVLKDVIRHNADE